MSLETRQRNATITIDGRQFQLAEPAPGLDPYLYSEDTAIQQQTGEYEFERRLFNSGTGWGTALATRVGVYAYADSAIMHQPNLFMPGCSLTQIQFSPDHPDPINHSRPSFVEYFNKTSAIRYLVIISSRHIHQISPLGSVTSFDMGPAFDLQRGMSKGVLYKNEAMSTAKLYIARPSTNPTDYMVEGTPTGYTVSPNNRYAEALAAGKNAKGGDVLWRIDANGKLNQAVQGADPSTPGAWQAETASASIAPTYAFTNDMIQLGRYLIIGRSDGFFTFDSYANAVPITRGHEQAQDARAGEWIRDANGQAIAPSGFGLITMNGLEWEVVGPVSANVTQRFLPGREVAVTSMVGNYIYCAVWEPVANVSWIFMGTPKVEGDATPGPFTWHGPIAVVPGEVTDIVISTVVGTKLWIATTGTPPRIYFINLDSTFAPIRSATAGYIYFPDGLLDMGGPAVTKDFRKVEYIFPTDYPYHATNNHWELEIYNPNTGTWVAPTNHLNADAAVRHGWWATGLTAKRVRARLRYQTSQPLFCALQEVIVRGIERPERSRVYRVILALKNTPAALGSQRVERTRIDDFDFLTDLLESGRIVSVSIEGRQFTAVVTAVKSRSRRSSTLNVSQTVEVELFEVDIRGS